MNTLEMVGIILGLVGAVGSGPVIASAVSKAADNRRKARLSYLWRLNDHGWAIVKPRYEGRKARIEDILAMQRLRDALTKNRVNQIDIDDDKPIPTDRNIILICGPDANMASAQIEPELRLSMEYGYDKELKKPFIIDHITGLKYCSPSDESGEQKDIALLAKLSFNAHPYIYLLCWGVHGPGTTGAAQMLLEPDFIETIRKGKPHDDFVAIVSVPYKSFDAIEKPTLIYFRKGKDVYRDQRA